MIKKIATCFLVMVIVAGCAQAPVEPEKPVDPPVFEQPQKPVEQEKLSEKTKVKKIDESKDWVYVEKTEIKDNDRFDLNPVLSNLDYNDFLDWLTLPFENHPKKEFIKVNINNESIGELNTKYSEGYNQDENTYYEFKWFMNDEIITIVNKYGNLVPNSVSGYFIESVNVDRIEGKQLTNEELLLKFKVTAQTIQDKINEFVEITKSMQKERFITKQQMLLGSQYTINYNNKSFLIVEDNILYCLVGYNSEDFANLPIYYKIKIA